jgi:hypothetical protein
MTNLTVTLEVTNQRERVSLVFKKSFFLGILSITTDVYKFSKENEPLEYIVGIFVRLFGKKIFCSTSYTKEVPIFYFDDVKHKINEVYIKGL